MGIELTANLTLITECDAIDDAPGVWDADASVKAPTLDTEYFLETTGSMSALLNEDKTPADYNFMRYTLDSAIDLTATHIFYPFNTAQSALLENKADGGIRLEVEDTSNTRGGWYLDGKDTYSGGWRNYTVDTTRTCDDGGTPNFSSIDTFLVHIFLTAASAKAAINTWVDVLRYGTGVTVQGGTSANPGKWSELLASSQSEDTYYGVIDQYGGVYYLQGKFYFGDNTNTSYFSDGGESIVFIDQPVSSNLYEIIVSGSKAVFELGDKVGGAGVGGCTLSQESLSGAKGYWAFDSSTYSVSGVRLYGCTFGKASSFKLPPYQSDLRSEVRNCNFVECDILEPSSCTFEDNNIISPPNIGLEMKENHNISDCAFINCPSGILISSAGGDYTFTNLTFAGCNKDIVNLTGTWISCSNDGTSDAGSYYNGNGSTTKITTTKSITISTIDEDGNDVSGAVVTIYSGTSSDALSNKTILPTSPAFPQTTWDGSKEYEDVSVNYNYTDWNAKIPITVRIRKSTPGTGNRYIPYKSVSEMGNANFSLTATLIEDPIVS